MNFLSSVGNNFNYIDFYKHLSKIYERKSTQKGLLC